MSVYDVLQRPCDQQSSPLCNRFSLQRPTQQPENATRSSSEPGLGHDFSRVNVTIPGPPPMSHPLLETPQLRWPGVQPVQVPRTLRLNSAAELLNAVGSMSPSQFKYPRPQQSVPPPWFRPPVPPRTPQLPTSLPPFNVVESATADVGYHVGGGHPVANITVSLQADVRAADFHLFRRGLFNLLEGPTASAVITVNPLGASADEVVGVSHQLGISALNLSILNNHQRIFEIAAQAGVSVAAGGATPFFGGGLAYHPANHFTILLGGTGDVTRQGVSWGAFTLGLQIAR